MTTKIELRRMTFYAYHGVAPQETRVGNTFIVDLILTAPLENAVWSDDLSDTITVKVQLGSKLTKGRGAGALRHSI